MAYLPEVLLIATGGTIAGTSESATRVSGYRPAALPVQALVEALPDTTGFARLRAEQPFSIGSHDITGSHWLQLAARIREALADPSVDGIVLTHGTDTMEETALFLDLVCSRTKPIVLAGAMRPATVASADGPLNLFNAIALAAHPSARSAGAMVLMNEQVLSADRAAKFNTLRVDAFGARDGGPLATMVDGQPRWQLDPQAAAARRPSLTEALAVLPQSLPRVDLVGAHVDADPEIVGWMFERGSRALVVAGTGNGTLSAPMKQALTAAAAKGRIIIRASRVATGPVFRDGGVEDSSLGFVAAGWLSPHKARIVASLGLAAGLDRDGLQRLMNEF